MSDQSSSQGNVTSVWGIIKGRIDTLVDRAMWRSHMYATGNLGVGGRFKLQFKNFLEDPLNHLRPGYQSSNAFHTIHQEIKGAVEKAVDTALSDLNVTMPDSSDKELFVEAVDDDIEKDVYNAIHWNATQHDSSFFESLSMKDETVFVALVSIGVVIPIIFFTLLFIFFYKRHRETKKRSREMLLRDQPDLCMDEYGDDDKCRSDDAVPDLDLKHLRI